MARPWSFPNATLRAVPWFWTRRHIPPCRFAVLFPGRTGSSFLISCLAEHPEVRVEGEGLARQDAESQRRWLAALYDAPQPTTCRAVGFKTKLKDVWDLAAFAEFLRARGVRIIVLQRRNIVKLAVSTLNARRLHDLTGRWNRTAGTPELGPLRVAPQELADMIAGCANAQTEVTDYARATGLPTLELDYEDLLADRAAWLRRVTDYLEVAPRALAGSVEKATHDDLRVALADHDAHAAYFARTPFAECFSA